MQTIDFERRLAAYQKRTNQALLKYLPATGITGTTLEEAMHYATMNGGKRVRPVLVYATGRALDAGMDLLDVPAAAIECLHAYSLIHDDLPAMDNDDLRRGKPTCHIKYGEASAILAGDALQACAFSILATGLSGKVAAELTVHMIAELGSASGVDGMAAGQAIDLQSVGKPLDLQQLEAMHRLKTGALIRASVVMGAMCARADTRILDKLRIYGDSIGLAFQIVDDILDVTADTSVIGKPQGADAALNKPTFPSILGLDGAQRHASLQYERAIDALANLGPGFDELRTLAHFIVDRSS